MNRGVSPGVHRVDRAPGDEQAGQPPCPCGRDHADTSARTLRCGETSFSPCPRPCRGIDEQRLVSSPVPPGGAGPGGAARRAGAPGRPHTDGPPVAPKHRRSFAVRQSSEPRRDYPLACGGWWSREDTTATRTCRPCARAPARPCTGRPVRGAVAAATSAGGWGLPHCRRGGDRQEGSSSPCRCCGVPFPIDLWDVPCGSSANGPTTTATPSSPS